jgi:hypothetical protein
VVIGLVSVAALPTAEPLITGAAETAAVPARPMPPATRIANRVPRIFKTPLLCVSTSNEITACPARFAPLALHAKAGFNVFVIASYQLGHDEFVAAPECISTGTGRHRKCSPPIPKIDQELRKEHGEVVHRLFIALQRSTTLSWASK